MPCYDERTSPSYVERETSKKWMGRLNQMTARACRLARELEKHGHKVPLEDIEWWHAHKAFDRREGR